ncbi:hypothetical protein TrRE_jg4216, partial [Triparma retinervis]
MIALLKRVAGRRNAVRLGVALAVLVWIGKFWEERRKKKSRLRVLASRLMTEHAPSPISPPQPSNLLRIRDLDDEGVFALPPLPGAQLSVDEKTRALREWVEEEVGRIMRFWFNHNSPDKRNLNRELWMPQGDANVARADDEVEGAFGEVVDKLVWDEGARKVWFDERIWGGGDTGRRWLAGIV